VRDFAVVHEKLLHLFIVRRDLGWFDHVHPALVPDGRFVLEQRFPSGGDYVLFADTAPAGSPPQIFRLPLRVDGPAAPASALEPDGDVARDFAGRRVALRLTPARPRAGSELQLQFSLSRGGRPIDDLGLFLGAVGHCVIVHEDTRTVVHTHPHRLTAAAPPPAGPDVTFQATLPRRGRYKVWAQFEHEGEVVTASFVFDVD
jgi:hypothetical protein